MEDAMPKVGEVGAWARRRAPEIALAVLAGAMFLGCLGSMDLWGKREQRAVAETIDTVEHGHWLTAQIQGRVRLEKPPLPRWVSATLITLTGRRDQWLLRLPAALSALGMVWLAYALGRRIGGRDVGLASGLALTSMVTFVVEMRQAGNDGPLAFFTTLAIYAAWRRLHGGPADEPPGLPGERPGSRGWAALLWGALGLGFLCKGPIALLLAAIAVGPYLACARRFRAGMPLLWSGRGFAAFLLLALSWPVPVALSDPNAVGVWLLEMGQKAGSAGITHHKKRDVLATEWPGMTAPWTFVAALAIALPFFKRGRDLRPTVWLPWWWAVGNLAMFCLWSVAKPNYYLPCLPGVALLVGLGWVRVCRTARGAGIDATRARRFLAGHWIGLAAAAVGLAVFVGWKLPAYLPAALAASAAVLLGVGFSARAWRRGADGLTLAPLVGALAAVILVGYGVVAPRLNARNGHRGLAATLDRLLPGDVRTVMFYRELDEGLWYYLRDRALRPVPGSQPAYNTGFDLLKAAKDGSLIWDDEARMRAVAGVLVKWLEQPEHESPYILIRADDYDFFAGEFAPLVETIYREPELDRNELMLLKVKDGAGAPAVASGASGPPAR
jgi:4-amino-4-deoxy-L-arabinose transferase-like glycosyltransferase